MTDKTPEELAAMVASEYWKDDTSHVWDIAHDAYLDGYEAAKAAFLDEHYAIFYVDGVRYKVEKRGIVHSISNIQRIETKED